MFKVFAETAYTIMCEEMFAQTRVMEIGGRDVVGRSFTQLKYRVTMINRTCRCSVMLEEPDKTGDEVYLRIAFVGPKWLHTDIPIEHYGAVVEFLDSKEFLDDAEKHFDQMREHR